jgi:hypothetical protein
MYSGPHIKRDGLVFGYDTGANPSSNFDHKNKKRRFFKGRVSTNVVTNTNLDTGWSKGYQTAIEYNEIKPPRGVNSQVVGFNKSSSSSYWYSYGNYAPQTPNTTYTVSIYVQTRDSNFRIRFYTADNSETGRVWGSYITVPNDNNWHRVVWPSFLNPSNSQSDSLSFNMSMASSGDSSRTWFCAPQMEVGTKASPFVEGTRSTTNSLLDLTKSTTIDVSNVSFGSDGLPTFDGTDDYLDLGSDITFKTTGGWTVESVVKYNSVAGGYNNVTSPANFIGSDSITYNSWYWSVLNNKLALWNRSPGTWRYGSTTLQADTWYHVVLVSYDSGTSYQMYLNGVAEGGDHTTYSWNASYSGLRVRYIGRGNSSNTRLVNGTIPLTKIYNRALTAQEVQQNYKAYKNRFNI